MNDLTLPVPEIGFFQSLVNSIGGAHGASILLIVAVCIQIIMLFFKSKMGDIAGKYRLIIVYGLSLIGGVLGLKTAGMSFLAALIHANTLASAQVFGNQVWKQFLERPEDKDKLQLPP